MKTTKFFALAATFCLAILATKLNAQLKVDATIAPVNLLAADVNLGADFQIKPNFSLGVTAMYSRGDLWGLVDSRETVPVNLIAKYYFSPKHGSDGFYADVFARYVRRDVEATYKGDGENGGTKIDFTRQQAGLGFGLGYKVVSQKGFVFDFGTGIGRAIISDESINVSEEDYDYPSLIKLMGFVRIGVGYRFGMNQE